MFLKNTMILCIPSQGNYKIQWKFLIQIFQDNSNLRTITIVSFSGPIIGWCSPIVLQSHIETQFLGRIDNAIDSSWNMQEMIHAD